MANSTNKNVANGVTSGKLEAHLWESANILRGPVDAADFKTYVFPLLFFKRISDVYDEEYVAALAESDGDEEYARFPQNYRFQIPEDCHWSDVRVVGTNVGQMPCSRTSLNTSRELPLATRQLRPISLANLTSTLSRSLPISRIRKQVSFTHHARW